MKAPGFFARLFNRISGGRWFKDVQAYDMQQDKVHKLERESELNQLEARRDLHKGAEQTIADTAQEEEKKAQHQTALDKFVDTAKLKESASEKGYEILRSVYTPVPEKKDYLLKTPAKEGLYNEEHFKSLKVFSKDELDLSKIVIAPKGKIGPPPAKRISAP